MTSKTPRPPAELGEAGRRLWRSVLSTFGLEPHERELLRAACATADTIARLEAIVEVEGDMAESSQGTRVHPALVEARQQRGMLAKQVASLRLPAAVADPTPSAQEDGEAGMPQRRAGARGFYAVDGGA